MMLSQLFPGDKILDSYSGIRFLFAGASPYGEGILLITDQVIAAGAMDAPEPESDIENFRLCGNSDYALSNLHQWLNSDQDDWFTPSHASDTPPSEEFLSLRPTLFDPIGHNPYADKPGFLARFSKHFRENIRSSAIPCADADGGGVHTLAAEVFLPSAAELGLRTGVIDEGGELPLFRDFRMRYACPSRECLEESAWQPAFFRQNRTFWYWLRTPNPKTKGFVAFAHFVNPFAFKFACSPWMGIRPILSLREDMEVAAIGNSLGHYRFLEVRA